jgi:hypothetical protein
MGLARHFSTQNPNALDLSVQVLSRNQGAGQPDPLKHISHFFDLSRFRSTWSIKVLSDLSRIYSSSPKKHLTVSRKSREDRSIDAAPNQHPAMRSEPVPQSCTPPIITALSKCFAARLARLPYAHAAGPSNKRIGWSSSDQCDPLRQRSYCCDQVRCVPSPLCFPMLPSLLTSFLRSQVTTI